MTPTRPLLAALLLAPLAAHAAPDADGKRLYARRCASCHGADGSGNATLATNVLKIDPKRLDLGRVEAASITRERKREILLQGKDAMPGYEKKLKPEQVDPLLDYTLQLTEALRKR